MFERIPHFDGTRDSARPLARVEAVRAAGAAFRADMLKRPQVVYYESFELVRVPYPARFAYLNAISVPTPFVQLTNRLFVIQFNSDDGIKTLLAGPSDWEHQRETPFFAHLDAQVGPLAAGMERLLFRKTATVLDVLARIGLSPAQVDYITYDHLHTQNLTRWLGGGGQAAVFPNAKLLVMREEWESSKALIPWQNQWYCPGGTDVPMARVALLDDSVFLGDGSVALVRTKGHTEGNHSIVAHTPDGLKVTSENGVCLDAYAPEHSRVSGLADYARRTGAEVIINGNTQEYVVDQYISMVLEKSIAGPHPQDARFPNMAPSSEATAFWLFPGTAPTRRVGELAYGRLVTPTGRQAA